MTNNIFLYAAAAIGACVVLYGFIRVVTIIATYILDQTVDAWIKTVGPKMEIREILKLRKCCKDMERTVLNLEAELGYYKNRP